MKKRLFISNKGRTVLDKKLKIFLVYEFHGCAGSSTVMTTVQLEWHKNGPIVFIKGIF